MFRTMLSLLLSLLLANEMTAFLAPSPRRALAQTNSRIAFTTLFAEEHPHLGHLEPIPPPPESQAPDAPGLPKLSDWPCSVPEPRVPAGSPETPGLSRADWPTAIREPNVPVGDPSDIPGIPEPDLPPFTEEPQVP